MGHGFVEEVLRQADDVEKRLKIKLGKTYVGGHSQGAFLSHAVAAHIPSRIDGVLALSGGSWASARKLSRKRKGKKLPIPVAIVHAQNDPVVGLGASIYVYDAYIKAGHEDTRLFAPKDGAHMFMRLPVLPALKWLDLMNATRLSQVETEWREAERRHLQTEIDELRQVFQKAELVCESPQMKKLMATARRVAETAVTVLICSESVAARA